MKKLFLVILTVVFVLVGGFIILFELRTSVGNDAQDNQGQNGSEPSESALTQESVDPSVFVVENLKYTASYKDSSIPQGVNVSKTQTEISSVSFSKDLLTVILDQKQFCNSQQQLQKQIGKYFIDKTNITLTNEITKTEGYDKVCLVEIRYVISQIGNQYLTEDSDFSLTFQSDAQQVDTTPICVYNSKAYTMDDYFIAKDGCNTCSCKGGRTECTSDRVCNKN